MVGGVFDIVGSTGSRYRVTFKCEGQTLTLECTCAAGEKRQACKHLFALIEGEVSAVISENVSDVAVIRDTMQGTSLAKAYENLIRANEDHAKTTRALAAAKKAISRVLYEGR